MDTTAAIAIAAAAFLAAAALGYFAVLHLIPRRIMARVMGMMGKLNGINRFFHGKRPTAKARTIVRPAPDLIYSSLIYDLGQGRLRLSGELPPGYWSLSLYAANSDNFFVLNDRELADRRFDVCLASGAATAPEGSRLVNCPGPKGIALIRMFVPNDGAIAAIVEAQKAYRAEILP
jgi:uncharacterized membrane protein